MTPVAMEALAPAKLLELAQARCRQGLRYVGISGGEFLTTNGSWRPPEST